MNKELFQELEIILHQYTSSASSDTNYEFVKGVFKSDNLKFENQNCILFSNLAHQFTKPTCYDNFYIYNKVLNDPLDYIDWSKNNSIGDSIEENTKFDLILNIISPALFQNEDLLYFISNNPSKLGIIALDDRCLDTIKKLLIKIELQKQKVIQRFNFFPDLNSICERLKDFKNLTIATEDITINYSNLNSLLNESWLFNDQHFQNLSSLASDYLKEEFTLELKFIVIIGIKVDCL